MVQGKRSEHPFKTPNDGTQKKKQTIRQQRLALILTDTRDNEKGRSTREGYVVQKLKFENSARHLTFRGGNVAREEIYVSDDFRRHHDNLLYLMHHKRSQNVISAFGSVNEDFFSNKKLENLGRLHVEDILTIHHIGNPPEGY